MLLMRSMTAPPLDEKDVSAIDDADRKIKDGPLQ